MNRPQTQIVAGRRSALVAGFDSTGEFDPSDKQLLSIDTQLAPTPNSSHQSLATSH